jgi:hypothetical protein
MNLTTATLLQETSIGVDSNNNTVYGPNPVAVFGIFDPGSSSELVQGQDTVITQASFYLDASSPVPAPTDKLQIGDVVYEVDGTPEVYDNPFGVVWGFDGFTPGPVLRLQKVTG